MKQSKYKISWFVGKPYQYKKEVFEYCNEINRYTKPTYLEIIKNAMQTKYKNEYQLSSAKIELNTIWSNLYISY